MAAPDALPRWSLTLYVNGASPRSIEAIESVRRVCDDHLENNYDLSVVDGVDHPTELTHAHVLALPTLVKHSPLPQRYVVGRLTDLDRVRLALDLAPGDPHGPTTGRGAAS